MVFVQARPATLYLRYFDRKPARFGLLAGDWQQEKKVWAFRLFEPNADGNRPFFFDPLFLPWPLGATKDRGSG
jgi:hypothetical protein